MITQAQIGEGIRYVSGYIATAGAIIVTIGLLPADTAHSIVDQSQKVLTDLQQTISDGYLLAGLVFPVIMAAIARMGWKSASPVSQAKSVNSLDHAAVVTTDKKLAVAAGVPLVEKLPS
ncbi:MAG TPA: hypothetical protein VFA65_24375 [Bryobacteraceae bacterium]|nr:hypothetical protein [Bryobacteraceae bacterium]